MLGRGQPGGEGMPLRDMRKGRGGCREGGTASASRAKGSTSASASSLGNAASSRASPEAEPG